VGTFTRITLVRNDSDFEGRLEHNEMEKLTPCRARPLAGPNAVKEP
jgi:hypothetical protein